MTPSSPSSPISMYSELMGPNTFVKRFRRTNEGKTKKNQGHPFSNGETHAHTHTHTHSSTHFFLL